MRLRVILRNVEGLKARLEARTAEQRRQIKAEMVRSSVRVFAGVQALTPVDTGFMRRQLRRTLTREGYNYAIGWYSSDFLGVLNPVSQRVITFFYVVPIIYGSKRMAGRDPLTPALREEREILRGNIAAILGGVSG